MKNPTAQKKLHMSTEAIALGLVAPALVFIAKNNPQLPARQRQFLVATAIGTLAVDGYFLWKWMQEQA